MWRFCALCKPPSQVAVWSEKIKKKKTFPRGRYSGKYFPKLGKVGNFFLNIILGNDSSWMPFGIPRIYTLVQILNTNGISIKKTMSRFKKYQQYYDIPKLKII